MTENDRLHDNAVAKSQTLVLAKPDDDDLVVEYEVDTRMANPIDFEDKVYENVLETSTYTLTNPAIPHGHNLFFEGWYTDSAFTNFVTFPYTTSNSVTFYPNLLEGNVQIVKIEDGTDVYGEVQASSDTTGTVVIPDYYEIDGVYLQVKTILNNITNCSKIYIGSHITEIKSSFMKLNKNIEEVVFSKNSHCKTVGEQAFFYCTKLTKIEIPYGVISIGDSAFRQCTSLQEIQIPNSV
jgi:hypothetical protein